MNLTTDVVPWFQMAATVITGLGVIVSTRLGLINIENNRRDRLAKIQPFLAFDTGGQVIPVQVHDLETIPGRDPSDSDLQRFLATAVPGTKCIRLLGQYRRLFNYGAGGALNTSIWLQITSFEVNGTERVLTRAQLESPPYPRDWNEVTASPPNLLPNAEAFFGILPAAIYVHEPGRTSAAGYVGIRCTDAEGNPFEWTQPVRFEIAAQQISISFGAQSSLVTANTAAPSLPTGMELHEWMLLAMAAIVAVQALFMMGNPGSAYWLGLFIFPAAVAYAFWRIKQHFDRLAGSRHG